jgi:hypothetical protein
MANANHPSNPPPGSGTGKGTGKGTGTGKGSRTGSGTGKGPGSGGGEKPQDVYKPPQIVAAIAAAVGGVACALIGSGMH